MVVWGTWKAKQLPAKLSELYGCFVQGQGALQHNSGKGSQQNAGPIEMLACFGHKIVSRKLPICPHGQGVKLCAVLFPFNPIGLKVPRICDRPSSGPGFVASPILHINVNMNQEVQAARPGQT